MVLPELFIAGYPPEDLVLKPAFQAACRAAIEALARETADGGPALLIGTPWVEDGKLYNACALLDGGRIAAIRYKVDLPNYGVFDEKRVFAPGPMPGPVDCQGRAHRHSDLRGHLGRVRRLENVVECLAETGGEILLVPNGSPYGRDKNDVRLNDRGRARDRKRAAADLSQPGRRPGRTGVRRRLVRAQRRPVARARSCRPSRERRDAALDAGRGRLALRRARSCRELEGDKADYAACVLGLRDYVDKNGFPGVVLGLSGGIDSALCAAMAVDALGAGARARRDAAVPLHLAGLARRCGEAAPRRSASATTCCRSRTRCEGFEKSLRRSFAGLPRDVTEENLQARARGTILMAISNKFGAMVVTTGNKSEMSVGYATLYGDMNGGFNPIKDLYKTEVFRLSPLRNALEAGGRARARRAR